MVDGVGSGVPANGRDGAGDDEQGHVGEVPGAAAAEHGHGGEEQAWQPAPGQQQGREQDLAQNQPERREPAQGHEHDQPRDPGADTAGSPAQSAAAEPQSSAGQPVPADPNEQTEVIRHVPVLPTSAYAGGNHPAYSAGAAPTSFGPGAAYDREGGSASGGLISRLPRRGLIAAGGLLAVAAIGGIAVAVSGGSGGKNDAGGGSGGPNGGSGGSNPSPSPTYAVPAVTTVPADGATGVDPSKPITVSIANGTITSVQLSGGQETSGTLSEDRSSWTSNGVLNLSTSYRLQIQAADKGGKTVTKTVSFSTLKPTATIGVLEMWPGSGVTVGVGQPVRVQFTNYVPSSYRADVEKACTVTTSPPVAGAWHWVDTDTMDWRPQDFWQTGTQVTVALNLAGVRAGAHQYFLKNHSLDFTIRDTDLRLIVDAKAYKATAYQNGQAVRTFPIDTGTDNPSFITWSGTLAVLGKGNPVEMKGDYGNGDKYDELVNWATQLTYTGTYIHAAPWDGEIGRVNSSHGCIHARTSDATWFYNLAHVGDVVQVTGTSKTVAVTNGFGDWTMSWSSWLSGSAYGATLGGKPVSG